MPAGYRCGFTLIELLCVIAIIAILSLLAMPLLFNWEPEWELEAAAWDLAAKIRLARQVAITRRKTTRIEFREAAGDYRIFFPGDPEEKITLPEGIYYGGINFPSSGGVHLLSFTMSGAPNQGGTVILINRDEEKRYVIVTPATGRVRVSEDPPESW